MAQPGPMLYNGVAVDASHRADLHKSGGVRMANRALEPADTLPALLAELARTPEYVVLRHYAQGDLLYRQGEVNPYLFYDVKGRVRIYVLSPDGHERSLFILGAGDLLNDVAFYLRSEQPASAEAFESCVEAYEISQVGFERALAAAPCFAHFFLTGLARKTLLLTQELISSSFQDVQGRVQLTLIRLANHHGIVTPQGIAIGMRVTHEEIAKLVGANRGTVSTCMSELQRQGFYRVVDQRIVLASWAMGQVLPP
jgi:CRP/FNR family cyclic AMP-dependent transcriptional regulator